jgi:LPXTG-motif cell wall-anchored protein
VLAIGIVVDDAIVVVENVQRHITLGLAPAEAAAAPAKLPKTGSELPLVGLLGLLCVSLSLGIKLIRTSVGQ